MAADIFDELERIVPLEQRDEFLRLARELRDYGSDNPELLRLIEAVGLTSLYTEALPDRIAASIGEKLVAFMDAQDAAIERTRTLSEIAAERLQSAGKDEEDFRELLQRAIQGHGAALTRIVEGLNDRLCTLFDALNKLNRPIREHLDRIEQVARRAKQIQAIALLISLVAAFALGAVLTLGFLLTFLHK